MISKLSKTPSKKNLRSKKKNCWSSWRRRGKLRRSVKQGRRSARRGGRRRRLRGERGGKRRDDLARLLSSRLSQPTQTREPLSSASPTGNPSLMLRNSHKKSSRFTGTQSSLEKLVDLQQWRKIKGLLKKLFSRQLSRVAQKRNKASTQRCLVVARKVPLNKKIQDNLK